MRVPGDSVRVFRRATCNFQLSLPRLSDNQRCALHQRNRSAFGCGHNNRSAQVLLSAYRQRQRDEPGVLCGVRIAPVRKDFRPCRCDWNPSAESRRSEPLSPHHGHLDFECAQVGPHEPVAAQDGQGATTALNDTDAKRNGGCTQPNRSGELCPGLLGPEIVVRPPVRRSSIRRRGSSSRGGHRSRCVGHHFAEKSISALRMIAARACERLEQISPSIRRAHRSVQISKNLSA